MKELLYLKDDQLKDLIEKLFIGYRETFSDSKKILNKYSIGLAHQIVIHLLSKQTQLILMELIILTLMLMLQVAVILLH